MKGWALISLSAALCFGCVADGFKTRGLLTPLVAAGSLSYEDPVHEAEVSGLSLFPRLPALGDLLAVHLHTRTSWKGMKGAWSHGDDLALPGLGFSLYDSRQAVIEEDLRLCSLWDVSLFRKTGDLQGRGYSPLLCQMDATRLIRGAFAPGKDGMNRLSAYLDERLDEGRSGYPRDRLGLIDPVLVFERRGEEWTALGLEPLFFYDDEEGLSLPLLLVTFDGEGVRFGTPALTHLFPLAHGDPGGKRYGFLANFATLYRLDDYTAFDLKLLFNYQCRAARGCSWGFLPYPYGDFHEQRLEEGIRFIQFPGHAISYRNVDGEFRFDLLPPLLFSWSSSATPGREGGELDIGPFGLLFNGEWRRGGGSESRFLLYLFGLKTAENLFSLDFLGFPVFHTERGHLVEYKGNER